MSELKVYVPQDGPYGLEPEEGGKLVEEETCYLKSDVDAVIAEKDKALEFAKALTLKDIEIIKEKDNEIAELKAKLESVQASTYVDSVDAGMRERKLKRALWLMTAEWAEGMGLASCNIAIKLSFKERFFYNDEANREKDIKKYRHRQVVFYKYADYCRAKADEYK